jgi:hypothetical protein
MLQIGKELVKRRGAALRRQREATGGTLNEIAFLSQVDATKLRRVEVGELELSRREQKTVQQVLFRLLEERARTIVRAVETCQRRRSERAKEDLQELGA